MAEYEKGKTYPGDGVYLGERINDAALIVNVFEQEDGSQVEVVLSDEEQAARKDPDAPFSMGVEPSA